MGKSTFVVFWSNDLCTRSSSLSYVVAAQEIILYGLADLEPCFHHDALRSVQPTSVHALPALILQSPDTE